MSESTTKHSYADQMKHIRSYTGKLSTAIPEVMKDFYALSKASSASGVIDSKTKELIALAIAVAIHCDDCIAFHTNSALHAGATKEEITWCRHLYGRWSCFDVCHPCDGSDR
jgi:AhpD family alkylhydroperoxidase